MRGLLAAALLIGLAAPAGGAVVASAGAGIVVAHDGVVDRFDAGGRRLSTLPGVEHATAIVNGGDRVAVLDAWSNRARLIDLTSGTGRTIVTGETPIAGVFADGALFVLERDARVLARFGADGARTSVTVADDPSFVGQARGRVYVYSRLEGLLQEIDPRGGILRTASVGAFAADMIIDASTAYLVFPREARLVSVDLETLSIRASVAAGGAPSSVALVRSGGAMSAAQIGVADPAAKRVWISEGAQSFGAAFGRGFVRGLLGLRLFRVRSAAFPTGVDRVVSANGVTLAFDSATGTLYKVDGASVTILGEGIAPQAFAVVGRGAALWRNGSLSVLD